MKALDDGVSDLFFIVLLGVKGVVMDTSGTAIRDATVHIQGRLHSITTNEHGEFWRLLLPGSYTIKVIEKIIKLTVIQHERIFSQFKTPIHINNLCVVITGISLFNVIYFMFWF